MATLKQHHLAMMNNALWKDDEYLANLHINTLNRLDTDVSSDYSKTVIRKEEVGELAMLTDKENNPHDEGMPNEGCMQAHNDWATAPPRSTGG